jgi:hypothetical protein
MRTGYDSNRPEEDIPGLRRTSEMQHNLPFTASNPYSHFRPKWVVQRCSFCQEMMARLAARIRPEAFKADQGCV